MSDKKMDETEGLENEFGENGARMQACSQTGAVRASIEPGICGFSGSISASLNGQQLVALQIVSECENIQRLAGAVEQITLRDLFLPISRNPIFAAAEKAKCHTSCPYPTALIKVTEVALKMALPKAVNISFES